MTPSIGRIIHTAFPGLPCRAGIITAVTDHAPTMMVGVFQPHRSSMDATIVTIASDRWHDPRDCPSMPLITAWDGRERRLDYLPFEGPEKRTNIQRSMHPVDVYRLNVKDIDAEGTVGK